jgi:hypothetical protein
VKAKAGYHHVHSRLPGFPPAWCAKPGGITVPDLQSSPAAARSASWLSLPPDRRGVRRPWRRDRPQDVARLAPKGRAERPGRQVEPVLGGRPGRRDREAAGGARTRPRRGQTGPAPGEGSNPSSDTSDLQERREPGGPLHALRASSFPHIPPTLEFPSERGFGVTWASMRSFGGTYVVTYTTTRDRSQKTGGRSCE